MKHNTTLAFWPRLCAVVGLVSTCTMLVTQSFAATPVEPTDNEWSDYADITGYNDLEYRYKPFASRNGSVTGIASVELKGKAGTFYVVHIESFYREKDGSQSKDDKDTHLIRAFMMPSDGEFKLNLMHPFVRAAYKAG